MTVNFDELLRHQLQLERLATGGYRNLVLPSLQATQEAINKILLSQDIVATQKELNQITRLIREQIDAQSWAEVTTNLEDLAKFEANWQGQFLGAAFAETLDIPKDSTIVNYVTRAIMSLESASGVTAGTWAQFIQGNKDSQIRTVNNIVRDGYARGRTGQQIARQIKQQYDGRIARNAETLVRTGYIHYAAQANEAMINDNKDILHKYYYVITFDNRTSFTCINADVRFNTPGKRFNVGDKNAPTPPLHFACRTRRIAVPKGWTPDGEKASIGGKLDKKAEETFETRKDRRDGKVVKYRGRKDPSFKAGTINANTTYEAWLKTQPEWFVSDVLGKTKADLFLSGEYSLKSFTDMTGRPLTLDEIIANQ